MLNPHKCIQYIDINFSELIDVLKAVAIVTSEH